MSNPFLNAEFYQRMRDYTERDAAFSKELKAIGRAINGEVIAKVDQQCQHAG